MIKLAIKLGDVGTSSDGAALDGRRDAQATSLTCTH